MHYFPYLGVSKVKMSSDGTLDLYVIGILRLLGDFAQAIAEYSESARLTFYSSHLNKLFNKIFVKKPRGIVSDRKLKKYYVIKMFGHMNSNGDIHSNGLGQWFRT